jgi:hypothetical protein
LVFYFASSIECDGWRKKRTRKEDEEKLGESLEVVGSASPELVSLSLSR